MTITMSLTAEKTAEFLPALHIATEIMSAEEVSDTTAYNAVSACLDELLKCMSVSQAEEFCRRLKDRTKP